MNLPNKLTVLRVLMIPLFLVALFLGYKYTAVVIFSIASATDWLDGYIARKYNLVTNFGKFMDPLADKLLVCAAIVAMVELRLLPAWVVIILISREFIITGFRLVAVSNNLVIAAGMWGKIKTVVQMCMIIFVLLDLPGAVPHIISNVLIFGSVLFTVISATEYIVKNIHVLKEEG